MSFKINSGPYSLQIAEADVFIKAIASLIFLTGSSSLAVIWWGSEYKTLETASDTQ